MVIGGNPQKGVGTLGLKERMVRAEVSRTVKMIPSKQIQFNPCPHRSLHPSLRRCTSVELELEQSTIYAAHTAVCLRKVGWLTCNCTAESSGKSWDSRGSNGSAR